MWQHNQDSTSHEATIKMLNIKALGFFGSLFGLSQKMNASRGERQSYT
jgi:hypothetical protein